MTTNNVIIHNFDAMLAHRRFIATVEYLFENSNGAIFKKHGVMCARADYIDSKDMNECDFHYVFIDEVTKLQVAYDFFATKPFTLYICPVDNATVDSEILAAFGASRSYFSIMKNVSNAKRYTNDSLGYEIALCDQDLDIFANISESIFHIAAASIKKYAQATFDISKIFIFNVNEHGQKVDIGIAQLCNDGAIWYVGIIPSYRGHGLSKPLMTCVLDYASEHGINTCIVSESEMATQQGLYSKLGFEINNIGYCSLINNTHPFTNVAGSIIENDTDIIGHK
jgi:GNAT superfamily N-acetyltransferase